MLLGLDRCMFALGSSAMPDRKPEPSESRAAAPFLWIETAQGNVELWARGHLLDDDLGGPLAAPEGGNKVATQGADTDGNTPQPLALEAA
jgi:hypothetical protein